MFHFLTSGVIACIALIFANAAGETMLGAGTWSVVNVRPCENDAEYPWHVLHLRRHKFNRTHDAFDGAFYIGDEWDESYDGRAEVCKMVDGGCKHFGTYTGSNVIESAKKYSESNLYSGLEAIGVEPPYFPIPAGEYTGKDFVVNMEDTCKEGLYGEFGLRMYLVKDGRDVACAQGAGKYEPLDYAAMLTPYG